MKTGFHCGVSMSEGLTSHVNTKNQALSQKLKSGSPKRIDFFPGIKSGTPGLFSDLTKCSLLKQKQTQVVKCQVCHISHDRVIARAAQK